MVRGAYARQRRGESSVVAMMSRKRGCVQEWGAREEVVEAVLFFVLLLLLRISHARAVADQALEGLPGANNMARQANEQQRGVMSCNGLVSTKAYL